MSGALDAPIPHRARLTDSTVIAFDAIPDGWVLIRSGATFIGIDPATLSGSGGTDLNAWHKAGDSYSGDQKIGNLHAGPNKLSVYNNNAKWIEFSEDSVGGINAPRKNILLGNEFTPGTTDGASLQYKRTDTWALLNLICTQDGSAGQGTGESLFGLANDVSDNVVMNMIGSAFAGTTYGVNTARQGRIRCSGETMVIGMINAKPLIFFTNDTPCVKITPSGYLTTTAGIYAGGFADATPYVANEIIRAKGILHVDGLIGAGADLATDPAYSLHVRRDANDFATIIVLDNRNTGGSEGTSIQMGNNPRGTNNGIGLSYFNSDNSAAMFHSGAGALTMNAVAAAMVLKGENTLGLTLNSSKVVTSLAFEPAADNSYRLGDVAKRFTTLYSAALNTGDIHMDNEDLDSHWTLREAKEGGEDPDTLYAINRRTFPFRKYKVQLVAA